MKHTIILPFAFTLALASCGKFASKKDEAKPVGPFGPTGIPPHLRANSAPESGTPVTPGGNAGEPQLPSKLDVTPESDTVYTDPDNPEAGIPELTDLLDSAPKKRGPWEMSETIAKQRAIHEGKPLLIWFTDSKTSPMCKALSQELFDRQDFAAWADEKLVRLKVDSNFRTDRDKFEHSDEAIDHELEVKDYVTALKKRYKVLGAPTLLLLNPSGEVIGRYRGYKRGESDFTWGLIKQGEASSAAAYQSWRSGLEKKGYREWSDRKGRKVFAKLTGYSNGTLTLIQPDGSRCKTQESKLSDADKSWITEQKKLRGL